MANFEGLGYGLLNDALGFLRSDEGFALPSRYEIEIGQPTSLRELLQVAAVVVYLVPL